MAVNKKSLDNLKQRFDSDSAKEANKKSLAAKAWKKTVREAINEQITPEEVATLIIKMARRHNLKAIDMILDITGAKAAVKLEFSRVIQETTEEFDKYFEDLEKRETAV